MLRAPTLRRGCLQRHWLLAGVVFFLPLLSPTSSLADAGKSRPVRRSWALLVGVTYKGVQSAAYPELSNAANDAKALAAQLKKFYDGYRDDTVIVLTDDGEDRSTWPTLENINRARRRLEKEVRPNDSVLLFFAGHAAPTQGRVVFLPRDYEIKNEPASLTPASTIDLKALPEKMDDIRCRQRLLVLDCCYAGAVFEGLQRKWTYSDKSVPESLFLDESYLTNRPAFQVVVSARSTQPASDGRGANSTFTTQLLSAMTFLGARRVGSTRRYVLARELVEYVRLRMERDELQRPDCRNLLPEGEFCLFPRTEKGLFDEFRIPVDQQSELLAAVASQQGHWWFEEMPWCIPGIRSQLFQRIVELEKQTAKRGSSQLIPVLDPQRMRAVAEKLLREVEERNQSARRSDAGGNRPNALVQMRFRYAKALLDAQGTRKLRSVCERIERELTEWSQDSERDPLKAEDLHLLAAVRHALRHPDGGLAYEEALRAYEKQVLPKTADDEKTPVGTAADRPGPTARLQRAIPQALCYADYGEFCQTILNKPGDAIKQYAKAIGIVRDFEPSLTTPLHSRRAPPPVEENAAKEAAESREGGAAKAPAGGSSTDPTVRHASESAAATGDHTNRSEVVAKLFSVFVLTRMADCHLTLSHWDDAHEALDRALIYVQEVAAGHYLEAHVHRRRAWAEIIRWKMTEAIRSFSASNDILDTLFREEALVRDGRRSASARAPHHIAADHVPQLTRLPAEFFDSRNHAAKLAYLHNLHGIAMA